MNTPDPSILDIISDKTKLERELLITKCELDLLKIKYRHLSENYINTAKRIDEAFPGYDFQKSTQIFIKSLDK